MSLKPKRVDFATTWNDLQETVKGVITLGNVPRGTWNDRFSDVYSLCVAYPEPLADKLYGETKKFLENHVSAQLDKVKKAGEQNLLSSYHDSWKEFSRGIDYLHKLYLYLNTQHIKTKTVRCRADLRKSFSRGHGTNERNRRTWSAHLENLHD